MRVISLGAGVQSSTLFLLSCLGELPKADVAIFADTGAEPRAVYRHLMYLSNIGAKYGIPVETVKQGDLEDRLLKQDERFGSVPFFIVNPDGTHGMGRRQCTAEYKIRPINRRVKELLAESGEKQAEVWIGISTDEIRRMKDSRVKYTQNCWPLIDMRWSRADCLEWYNRSGFKSPPRSACVFCPFHNDHEWAYLKQNDPDGWGRAVAVDKAIRKSRGFNGQEYLHAKRIPIDEIEFSGDPGQLNLFENDCEGMCGI